MGKLQKSVTVETNDPNQPTVKLTLLVTVEVELAVEPATVYFKDMKEGEQSTQRVHLTNTSQNLLKITSIDPKSELVKVELINKAPEWPVELKPTESLDLLVNLHYRQKGPRFSEQVDINYAGGEVSAASFRVYATAQQAQQPPSKLPEPAPGAKTLPEETPPPLPPPPPMEIRPQAPETRPPVSETKKEETHSVE